MKLRELKKIVKQETSKVVNEKLNFVLGPTIHGDPNKPMKDDFKIAFTNPKKAIMTIMQVNKDLQSRGLEPVKYDNVGIVFNKPSNQQMQFILNAFNNEDVMSVGRVLKEGTLSEAVDPNNWPIGHFEVINTFKISPGGGWVVSFNKGDILRVEDAAKMGYPGIQKIVKWDALKNDWVTKRPPISGMEVFPINKFAGSYNWVNLFTQNTKALSKGAAESKAKSMAKETVLSARDAIKMLQGLSQNQQVKITLI
jgi:hypothetical protein